MTDSKYEKLDIGDFANAYFVGLGTFSVMGVGTIKVMEIMHDTYLQNQAWINNYFGRVGEFSAEYIIPGLFILSAIQPIINITKTMFHSSLEEKLEKIEKKSGM